MSESSVITFHKTTETGDNPVPIQRSEAEYLFAGIFPGHTIQLLLDSLEFAPSIKFTGDIRINSKGVAQFKGTLIRDGKASHDLNFSFSKKDNTLYLANIDVLDGGAPGLARPILNKLLDDADTLGLKNRTARASKRDGGWMWAVLGGVPSNRHHIGYVSDEMLKPRLEAHRQEIINRYGVAKYAEIHSLLNDLEAHPENLRDIARIRDVRVNDEGKTQSLGRVLLRDIDYDVTFPSHEERLTAARHHDSRSRGNSL